MIDARPYHVESQDPDPIVDVLNILAALGSLASIGSFAQSLLQERGKSKERKIRRLMLIQQNAETRLQLDAIRRIYSNIRDLRDVEELPADATLRKAVVSSRGVQLGTMSIVREEGFKRFITLRKRLFRRVANLQVIVADIMLALKDVGLSEESPYKMYGRLQESINEVLRDRKRPFLEIEDDVAKLLKQAEVISAIVGNWLQRA